MKTLNEIHEEKLQPTTTHGYKHRTYVPSKKPVSFELKSVLQESGVKVRPNSNVGDSNDTHSKPPTKSAVAVMHTKTIFTGSHDASSIFSPEYKGSEPKGSVETLSPAVAKQESLKAPSSDKGTEGGMYPNTSTPAGAQDGRTSTAKQTPASADQKIPRSGQPGSTITPHVHSRQQQIATETKGEQPVTKKVCSTLEEYCYGNLFMDNYYLLV